MQPINACTTPLTHAHARMHALTRSLASCLCRPACVLQLLVYSFGQQPLDSLPVEVELSEEVQTEIDDDSSLDETEDG